MAIIALFSAAYCHGRQVAETVAEKLGYRPAGDEFLDAAAKNSGASKEKLLRAMQGPPFVFNRFTHQREKLLAYLKIALAERLEDGTVTHGFEVHLIPRRISHVLKVCLLADLEQRLNVLREERRVPDKEARKAILDSDGKCAQWTQHLFNLPPWDKSLYDLKIPLNAMAVERAADLIAENARKDALKVTDDSRYAQSDFLLAAKAGLAITEAGHFFRVDCRDAVLSVVIDEYVLRLEALEAELRGIMEKVPGVRDVMVTTGPNYRPPSMFASVDLDMPSKILLVDDEQDFVLTLSERLEMRDMRPAVAYDGEEALRILKDEEPEVMVLDLKMPGIDGIEVLRRVKEGHPNVEVVILTGHGSEKDRNICMELGAFAYLEKPVDIETLSAAMKAAGEKAKGKKPT